LDGILTVFNARADETKGSVAEAKLGGRPFEGIQDDDIAHLQSAQFVQSHAPTTQPHPQGQRQCSDGMLIEALRRGQRLVLRRLLQSLQGVRAQAKPDLSSFSAQPKFVAEGVNALLVSKQTELFGSGRQVADAGRGWLGRFWVQDADKSASQQFGELHQQVNFQSAEGALDGRRQSWSAQHPVQRHHRQVWVRARV
jgi:hypothetical protein